MDTHSDVTHRPTDQHASSRESVGQRAVASRPRARRIWGGVAVVVVAALALAGCTSGSGEAGPTTQAPVSPSPSVSTPAVTPAPTATPSKTASAASGAPKRPTGMNANTAEGARKTALYFIQLYPYMLRTGDTKEWDRLSVKKQCEFCSEVRAKAVSKKKHHQVFSGGEIKAKVVTTYDRDTLYDAYPIDIQIDQQASVTHDKAGKVVATGKPVSSIVTVEAARVGRVWKILEIGSDGKN
ncbi:DUF6318 family protein [Luteimicrobium sp. NPDC057192]|uniref:DUF6318 family protein n=1 Tax=Luteimicrobium sp. NPDC057192 TaxID=3346042 RepID=UPI00362AF269